MSGLKLLSTPLKSANFRILALANGAVRHSSDWIPKEKETHTGQVRKLYNHRVHYMQTKIYFFRNGVMMITD